MESEKQQQPPPEPDSVPTTPATVTEKRHSGDHITLSSPIDSPLNSPLNSPADSSPSPLHSKHGSGGHISLSPPVASPGNSPPLSSLASEHISLNHSHGSSPENGELHSLKNYKPHSPEFGPMEVVVRKDVFKEPIEDNVVIEEPAVVSRAILKEPKAKTVAPKTDPSPEVAGGGGGGRRVRPSVSILRRAERRKIVGKAALGFRVFGFLFCLVSFSVMAADRNKGWALDSFDRYKEFRYSMSVSVIGFVYSGAQAIDLLYNLATGKSIVHHQQLRYYFDFAVDQVIAYLLISASSSASIRIDDWQANWGEDKFPNMATASISMSFLAFVALAASSLISGYSLCTSKSV